MTRAFVSLPITIVLASGTGFLMHHASMSSGGVPPTSTRPSADAGSRPKRPDSIGCCPGCSDDVSDHQRVARPLRRLRRPTVVRSPERSYLGRKAATSPGGAARAPRRRPSAASALERAAVFGGRVR